MSLLVEKYGGEVDLDIAEIILMEALRKYNRVTKVGLSYSTLVSGKYMGMIRALLVTEGVTAVFINDKKGNGKKRKELIPKKIVQFKGGENHAKSSKRRI